MIRVAINGAAGRMGRRLLDLASHEQEMKVVAAFELPGHPDLGRDAGELCGCGKLGVPLGSDWTAPADVLIDFSLPAAAAARAAEAAGKGVALVIGTTGLSADQKAEIAAAAKKVPVLHSPNMSVGVNLLFRLAARSGRGAGRGVRRGDHRGASPVQERRAQRHRAAHRRGNRRRHGPEPGEGRRLRPARRVRRAQTGRNRHPRRPRRRHRRRPHDHLLGTGRTRRGRPPRRIARHLRPRRRPRREVPRREEAGDVRHGATCSLL